MWVLSILCGSGLLFWLGVLFERKLVAMVSALALASAGGFFLASGYMPWHSVPAFAAVAVLGWGLKKQPCSIDTCVGWTLFIVFLLLLGFHQLPGFSPYSVAMDGSVLQFWPQKIFLLLLVVLRVLRPVRPMRQIRRLGSPPVIFGGLLCLTLAVLIPLALLSGYARWGWPSLTGLTYLYGLAYNLVFVCIVEESFFRGIIQTALSRWLRSRRWPLADGWAVVAASLLFGMAHLGGGAAFVLLATLAGLAYGTVFYATRRIHYAVLLHVTVNGVHQGLLAGGSAGSSIHLG